MGSAPFETVVLRAVFHLSLRIRAFRRRCNLNALLRQTKELENVVSLCDELLHREDTHPQRWQPPHRWARVSVNDGAKIIVPCYPESNIVDGEVTK